MKHVARKRFGQHFLTDDHVIARIVGEIAPRPGQAMVEIGPGLGAMTLPLLERCGAMTVIELDRDLAARLRRNQALTVVESDVLKVDFSSLPRPPGSAGKLRVVGNLPYNISTPILFHLLDFVDVVQDQHFMLQKEVVDRMAASPGGKDYGRLSVMLQWRYAIDSVLDVPPDAFDPPPKVDSAIVRMQPWPAARLQAVDTRRLGQVVTVAFSQRRKLLRHSLGRWLADQGFSDGFDLQRRAEEVPVHEYIELAQRLGPVDPTNKAGSETNPHTLPSEDDHERDNA